MKEVVYTLVLSKSDDEKKISKIYEFFDKNLISKENIRKLDTTSDGFYYNDILLDTLYKSIDIYERDCKREKKRFAIKKNRLICDVTSSTGCSMKLYVRKGDRYD